MVAMVVVVCVVMSLPVLLFLLDRRPGPLNILHIALERVQLNTATTPRSCHALPRMLLLLLRRRRRWVSATGRHGGPRTNAAD
eukprot:53724-Eustigmatos_ZCMA.PRE.1